MPKSSVAVIVLNWNDAPLLPHSVGSLLRQSLACDIIVVDNGSADNSREVIESFGDKIIPLHNAYNKGFAGGVNTGFRYAMEHNYKYVALLNNDATADKDWLKELVAACSSQKDIGGATSTLLHSRDSTYDSTGDFYTTWGLPFPRGRNEKAGGQYDTKLEVMAGSGGSTIFKTAMLRDVGLFDEDFFAYFEDVDLGLRAHVKGWRFVFAPKSIAYHATGSTSGRVKNFTLYQTLKNLPILYIKSVPLGLFITMLPKVWLLNLLLNLRALKQGHVGTVLKAQVMLLWLVPKKLVQRIFIRLNKAPGSDQLLRAMMVYGLPPNTKAKLGRLRKRFGI